MLTTYLLEKLKDMIYNGEIGTEKPYGFDTEKLKQRKLNWIEL